MSANGGQPRVIVIEDERELADLYEMWLADEYDVRTAYSGEAALERFTEGEADIILLDRRMPGLSGDEVAHRLDERGVDAQVVMVTAVPPSTDVAPLPVDDYVTKPVEREQLRSTVETAALVGTYDDRVSELLALTARQHALETAVPAGELATSEEVRRLRAQVTNLQDSLDDTVAQLWSQSNTNVFARVEPERTGHQAEGGEPDTHL
ncbi:MAG: two-component system response regulator AdeR [Natronomonas sp.]|jgi:two-component system response regulator AdeR